MSLFREAVEKILKEMHIADIDKPYIRSVNDVERLKSKIANLVVSNEEYKSMNAVEILTDMINNKLIEIAPGISSRELAGKLVTQINDIKANMASAVDQALDTPETSVIHDFDDKHVYANAIWKKNKQKSQAQIDAELKAQALRDTDKTKKFDPKQQRMNDLIDKSGMSPEEIYDLRRELVKKGFGKGYGESTED